MIQLLANGGEHPEWCLYSFVKLYPIVSNCARIFLNAETPLFSPENYRPPSKRYVQALEARIASLEQQVRELGGDAQHQSIDHDRPSVSPTTISFSNHITNNNASAAANDEGGSRIMNGLRDGYSPIEPASHEQLQKRLPNFVDHHTRDRRDPMRLPVRSRADSTDPDDLADMLGSFNLDDGGELRFFGAASNFHLIRDKDTFKDSSSTVARAQGIEAAANYVGSLPLDTNPELRDHLLDLYWRWQNSWQYIVARHIFLRDFQAGRSTRFCSPMLLATMLALASRYSDRVEVRTDPADPQTAGGLFAAQAKAMLHHECVAPTVATVQGTALLGLYSCAINQESLGWMYTGMAVRMAFSLGMHLDCSAYVASGLITPGKSPFRVRELGTSRRLNTQRTED